MEQKNKRFFTLAGTDYNQQIKQIVDVKRKRNIKPLITEMIIQ